MSNCYCCGSQNDSIALLCVHLRCHKAIGELTYPICCAQGQCTRTFHTVFCLKRHIQKFHPVASVTNDNGTAISGQYLTKFTAIDDPCPVWHPGLTKNYQKKLNDYKNVV